MKKRHHTPLEEKLMCQLGELERERDFLRAELRRVTGPTHTRILVPDPRYEARMLRAISRSVIGEDKELN